MERLPSYRRTKFIMNRVARLFPRGRLWTAIVVAVIWLIFVQIVFWTKSAKESRALQRNPLQPGENIPAIELPSANIHHRNTSFQRERRIHRQQLASDDVCFSISHSRGEEIDTEKRCPFVVVLTHSLDGRLVNTKDLSIFDHEVQLSFSLLAEFLQTASEYNAATCLQPSKANVALRDANSSWCRFARREWSMIIRNTGRWTQGTYARSGDSSALKYLFQECNIVQSPFLIREDVFEKLGRWRGEYGKASLLDFFLRSNGQLRVAKLANCVWSKGITKVDRGRHIGSRDFEEYSRFGDEHDILRIIKEDGIDWTRCIANHILCPERPYESPKALPEAALPICCSVVVYNLLNDFAQAADKLRIEYRLIYGTLLGAVRSNAIIPWTYDADVAIDRTAYDTPSTYPAFQKLLGDKYYIGNSYMDMPRMHPLVPPHLDLDTRPFFGGPDDLQGDAFFNSQIQDAVLGMLPNPSNWRDRTYLDVYFTFDPWLNGSRVVTINNRTFMTIKAIHYELTNWYGHDYLKPVLKGSWFGMSDNGSV